MKNPAFTLVELLTVIVLLGIIAAIVFPTVQKAIQNSQDKAYEEQKDTIIYAAQRWVTDNTEKVSTTSSTYKSIACLKKEGYLTSNKQILNPTTNEEMNGCVTITYDMSHKQFKYQYADTCPGTDICN